MSPVHGIFGWSLFWFETMYTSCIALYLLLCLLLLVLCSFFLFPLMRLLALALEMLPLEIFCTLPMARASPALFLSGALLIMYTYITTIYIYTTVYIHAGYDKLGSY